MLSLGGVAEAPLLADSSFDGPSGEVTAKSPLADGPLFAGLILESVGQVPVLPALPRRDAPRLKLLPKVLEALRLVLSQRDPLLQILGPKVGPGTPLVEALGPLGDPVPLRRPLGDPEAVVPVDLVLDRKGPLEVARPLLVLSPSLGVDGVPDDVHMRVFAVAVDEAGVVMAGGHPLRQLGADCKQLVVGDLTGLAVAGIKVEAGVVVLAAAVLAVDRPRHFPGRRQILRAREIEVVRPGRVAGLVARLALLLPAAPSVAEVGDHLGGRGAG